MALRLTNLVAVPEETAQVTRAAFPRGSLLLSLAMSSARSSMTNVSPPYSPSSANQPRPLGVWRS